MAVIISDSTNGSYDGNLATVNGFYRVEAYNLGCFSSSKLATTSARTISMTFANAGNCKGVFLCIENTISSSNVDRSLLVELQENTGAWTTRASCTYTFAQMFPESKTGMAYIPFVFSASYAVTTAAATWRLQISQTGGTIGNYNIVTSDGTNPFYACWCDNALSHTDGDAMLCKDKVTVNKTATFTGLNGTGDTTSYTAIVIGRSMTLTNQSTICMLDWEAPASAAYTLTINGHIQMGSWSGFGCGTSTNRISATNQAKIIFTYATYSGKFLHPAHARNDGSHINGFLYLYGEIPTERVATLASDAAVAATALTLVETLTTWASPDKVYVTKRDTMNTSDVTEYTVSSVVGTTLNLTAGIATTKALAGAKVIRVSQYGIQIELSTLNQAQALKFPQLAVCLVSGVYFKNVNIWDENNSSIFAVTESTAAAKIEINDNACTCVAQNGPTVALFFVYYSPSKGIDLKRNHCIQTTTILAFFDIVTSTFKAGTITVDSNIVYASNRQMAILGSSSASLKTVISNNIFENSESTFGQCYLSIYDSTISGNTFWGCNSAVGSNAGVVEIFKATNTTFSANSFNKCNTCYLFLTQSLSVAVTFTDDIFGNAVANTYDVAFGTSAFLSAVTAKSPTGVLNCLLTNQQFLVSGSKLGIEADNNTAEKDYAIFQYGQITKTGGSLADTTTRLGSGYAWKLTPTQTNGTDLFTWPLTGNQVIPSGNLQNKSPAVGIWVKINNAAYYAGTHTKPTLVVNYDNGTTVEVAATATTSWQRLAVSFTPLTTYGQYSWYLKAATDATGTNRDFYVDDFQNTYPNATVELGNLDLSANGEPVFPPVALNIISSAVGWDQRAADFNTDGTFGNFVNRILQILRRKI